MIISFKNLWKSLPQIHGVSYTSTGGISFSLPNVVSTALRTVEKEPSLGKYIQWVSTFKIDPDEWELVAPLIQPKSGDTFIALGLTWQVDVVVDKSHLDSLYRLVSNCLEFVGVIDDAVYYSQSSCSGGGTTGSRTVIHTVIGASMPCAIEPVSQHQENLFGSIATPETFVIYLEDDPSGIEDGIIKIGDMFIDQNNTYYEITEVVSRNRINMKPEFKVIKKL